MQIKEAGCAVYLCSNASHRLRVFEKEIPGIEYFDGVLCLGGREDAETGAGDIPAFV